MFDSKQVPPGDGIEGILLDIDNTIYNYDLAHEVALAEMAALFQTVAPETLTHEQFRARYRHYRTEVTRRLSGHGSSRSRLLAFQAMFEELGLDNAAGLALDFDEGYWARHIEVMERNDPLVKWLALQSAAGVSICVVTNMQSSVQLRKIRCLGVQSIITHFVSSEEVGLEKPDPRIFNHALQKLGTRAERTLMIGDSKHHDIDGARAVGLNTWQVLCYL